MGLTIKDYQRRAKAYENQWRQAMDDRDIVKAYKAEKDYLNNCKQQENELNKLDPNSREYDKLQTNIDKQKQASFDMYHEQRLAFSSSEKRNAMQEFNAEQTGISNRMLNAADRGNSGEYDFQRKQYERNIDCQRDLSKQLTEEGVDYEDHSVEQRRVELDCDTKMRDNTFDMINKRTEAGRPVSQELQQSADKYSKQVRQTETTLVKEQDEQIINGMRARGESEQKIAYQQEQNARSEAWVERLNG